MPAAKNSGATCIQFVILNGGDPELQNGWYG